MCNFRVQISSARSHKFNKNTSIITTILQEYNVECSTSTVDPREGKDYLTLERTKHIIKGILI